MGLYLSQLGDTERGLSMVRDATLLSPHPPTWFHMAFFYDHYLNGRYNEALAEARLLDWNGDFRIPLFVAASYGQLGRGEEAAPELTDRLLEGLAKAGLEGLSGS